eukprot:TRINITY_DN10805_c0_g1_i1.p1 TRINITY_DN10805_c0_g1~~TRINITY_DN10805_c0_g1_i1.p1  ORF type:complete len:199 (-),score=57.58 TRINITY_DN10805_c0_g1_i1:157-753(-)
MVSSGINAEYMGTWIFLEDQEFWTVFMRSIQKSSSYFPKLVLDHIHGIYKRFCWDPGREDKSIINDIITNLNHWSTGWTDWNLVLDMNGGPNWANNEVDAPIIVNQETDEFYKQPMYYGLAHFSKFLPEGSYRIKHDMEGYDSDRIQSVSFERPDGALVLIVTNQHMSQIVKIRIAMEGGGSEVISIGPQSVHSFIWM